MMYYFFSALNKEIQYNTIQRQVLNIQSKTREGLKTLGLNFSKKDEIQASKQN